MAHLQVTTFAEVCNHFLSVERKLWQVLFSELRFDTSGHLPEHSATAKHNMNSRKLYGIEWLKW